MSSLKQKLQTQPWISSVKVGVILGVTMSLTEIIPMAALIFSGQLEPFLPTGIGYARLLVNIGNSLLSRLDKL